MKANLSRLIKRVQATQENEIDCSACLDQISQYVDLEIATGSAAERMPLVRQHLEQCGVCHDEYQVLRDLAQMEANENLPTTEELNRRLKGGSV